MYASTKFQTQTHLIKIHMKIKFRVHTHEKTNSKIMLCSAYGFKIYYFMWNFLYEAWILNLLYCIYVHHFNFLWLHRGVGLHQIFFPLNMIFCYLFVNISFLLVYTKYFAIKYYLLLFICQHIIFATKFIQFQYIRLYFKICAI